jgi:hypothetical protein
MLWPCVSDIAHHFISILDARGDKFKACCNNFKEGGCGSKYIVKAPVLPKILITARVNSTNSKLKSVEQAVNGPKKI